MKRLNNLIGACFSVALLAACSGSNGFSSSLPSSPQSLRSLPAFGGYASHHIGKNVQTETVIYSFAGGSDGAVPNSDVINVGGTLYGTTQYGGANGAGSVFQIAGGVYSQLYSFAGGPSDGANPAGGLVNVGGTLYGTTVNGGSNNEGTVYKITTSGTETVLYNFTGGPSDGANPGSAVLVNVGGKLYGTTVQGGVSNVGTVFKVTTSGSETVLHSFGSGSDGSYPYAALVNVRGTLYGTTDFGGAYGQGTVFAITRSGTETVIHSLGNGTDGAQPIDALINVGGKLYGTTQEGGTSGDGAVFEATTSGTETVLYSFKAGSDGKNPISSLINVDGTLFGTTGGGAGTGCGGGNGCGTIFALLPTSHLEIVVHGFGTGTDGSEPGQGVSLINVNGTLYGTTERGGANGQGTVYSLSF